jgi:hypothetical protein
LAAVTEACGTAGLDFFFDIFLAKNKQREKYNLKNKF